MIKKLTLTAFRQFDSRSIDFTNGLNVLIGANEAGKTTTIEALVYAWFGANSLRQPVAEVVTWGLPVSKLKVELVQEFEGVTYFCKRSTAGAEVRYNDVTVTGQSEVTKLFESLLGVHATVASRLMLANQTDLRGALQGGPGKAVALIERLANLDLIDFLLEDIRNKHPNGNCDDVVAQRDAGRAALATIDLTPPDTATVEARIALDGVAVSTYDGQVKVVRGQIDKLDADRQDLQKQAVAATEEKTRRNANLLNLNERTVACQILQEAYDGMVNAYDANYASMLQERQNVQRVRKEAEAKGEAVRSWNAKVPALLGTLAYAPEADLGKIYSSLQDELAAALTQKQKALSRIAVLKATKITETACGLCGKDLQDVPEVVAKNSAADAEIDALEKSMLPLYSPLKELPAEIKQLESFDSAWSHHAKLAPSYAVKVSGKWGTFTLDLVVSTSTFEDPDLEKDISTYQQWLGTVAATAKTLAGAKTVIESLQKDVDAPEKYMEPLVYTEAANDLTGKIQELNLQYHEAVEAKSQAQNRINADRLALQGMANEFNNRKKMHETTENNIKRCSDLIEKTERTNGLIAILKAAKPKLAEKLWNSVLHAVSQYFTSVRGVESKVTRESNRFRVNNQPVEGLSGSTQDALGLAIRVALMQVFIPGTRLLVLDEPGAACDDNRESAMLGMVAGAGFSQILLVTHSRVADALADNIIEV